MQFAFWPGMEDHPAGPPLCSTGVDGLDAILHGGLPSEALYLVEGDPGVGKTTLALQFLLAGAARGHKALYITLSETGSEVRRIADSHEWSLKGIHIFELSKIEEQLAPDAINTVFHPVEVELNELARVLIAEIERVTPTLVVFDSLSELRLLSQTSLRYRRQLLSLKQYFSRTRCTVLLLDDRSSSATDMQVQSIAHGVICLERMEADYGRDRRRLSVIKLRGATFSGGFHDYIIVRGGLRVFPRLVAAEHRRHPVEEKASSGNAELDDLLGGGIDRGTSSLLIGPAGSGKSSIATIIAMAAAGRGERVSMFVFDESPGILLQRAKGLGIDPTAAIDRGLITITPVDPAELSPGELANRVREAVESGVRVIVIDSLNGYLHAMPAEKYLILQLHEMLSYLNQQGVMTVLVAAQQGLIGPMQSPVDLTYLADTVLLFRFFEYQGAVQQALSVLKKRSGAHQRTIHGFTLSAEGLRIGGPMADYRGILQGTPSMEAHPGLPMGGH
jgi:circadian clock protein KaiC